MNLCFLFGLLSCGEVGAPPPLPVNTTGEYHLCLIIGHYKIGHCGVQLAHFFLKGEERGICSIRKRALRTVAFGGPRFDPAVGPDREEEWCSSLPRALAIPNYA